MYTVRLICLDDARKFHRLVNDNTDQIIPFFSETLRAVKDLETTLNHLISSIYRAELRQRFVFVVEDKLSGRLLGSLEVQYRDRKKGHGEMAFYQDHRVDNIQIIGGALGFVRDFCFNSEKMKSLRCMVSGANKEYQEAARQNGFTFDRIVHVDFQEDNERVLHSMQYSLLNPDDG